MRRGRNVQHARRRRRGVIVPTLIIVACIPLLAWELSLLIEAVIG